MKEGSRYSILEPMNGGAEMRHAAQTVTVYHGELDVDAGNDVYHGRVLTGVSFHGDTQVSVSKDGLAAAALATMRIPGTGFSPVQKGDLVLLGTQETEGQRPGTLADLSDYVYTVVGVTDNTAGRAPHWKVVMK